MSEKRKVRTIVIDGIEIQTDLHAVEIADLPKKLAEVEKENKKYKEVIDKAKSKLTAMFANGDDNKILDDLLELGEILKVE